MKNILMTCFAFINLQSSNMGFRTTSAKEAILYIEKHKVQLSQVTDLKVANPNCKVYLLPNSEIVLLPGNLTTSNLSYPAFIFPNLEEFEDFSKAKKVPIPDSLLTEYEIEKEFIDSWNVDHFCEFLTLRLDIKIEPNTTIDNSVLIDVFRKAHFYFNEKRNSEIDKKRVVLALSVLIINSYVQQYHAKVELTKRFENYNEVTIPKLFLGEDQIFIESSLYSGLQMETQSGLQHFLSITQHSIEAARFKISRKHKN